jgi:16S rRNA (cytosine1402-N4)-methyltransferase
MLREVLEYLDPRPGEIIVDATIGTGGHSESIIEKLLPKGRLVGIDRDGESLAVARERLHKFGDACYFAQANFSDIDIVLRDAGVKKIDGALFDLGISSFQLGDPHRGFSFQSEGPLDMRLDRNSYISAYDLLNNLNEEEISSLLWSFGQERWHNRIARLLVEERGRRPIATTAQLSDIVFRAIPRRYRYRHYRIHPATRTFQAVRIAVNRELESLETGIEKAVELLNKRARICVISFHSLEDRIVKLSFRKFSSLGKVTIITPKPLTPGLEETEGNISSRSAKFRCAEKK